MGNLRQKYTTEEWDELQDKIKSPYMRGILHNTDHGWMVTYTEGGTEKGLSLHPDDIEFINDTKYTFDDLEAQIASNPEVEFEIVENQKLTGVSRYAKLINVNSKCPICGFKKGHSKHCRTKQRHLKNK